MQFVRENNKSSDFPYIIRTPWPESAGELYRPSDFRLSAKLVPTFEDRECHVGSGTDTYGRIIGLLDRMLWDHEVYTCNAKWQEIRSLKCACCILGRDAFMAIRAVSTV
jgi:hypothetical protein